MKRHMIYLISVLILISIFITGFGGSKDKVVVVMDATWPPFEFLDESTKEIVGFGVDLMNAIAEKAGFEVEYQNVSWDPLLAGMATCQYDAAISAMTITEERAKQFLFSNPYFAAGQIVTVRIDETEITGKDTLTGHVVSFAHNIALSKKPGKIDIKTLKVSMKPWKKGSQTLIGYCFLRILFGGLLGYALVSLLFSFFQ